MVTTRSEILNTKRLIYKNKAKPACQFGAPMDAFADKAI